eukprot:m.231934 g.231934  ORF g.231934 m.231934 type:complete len:61 (+) comp15702_c0_seq3:3090-3272(+)
MPRKTNRLKRTQYHDKKYTLPDNDLYRKTIGLNGRLEQTLSCSHRVDDLAQWFGKFVRLI